MFLPHMWSVLLVVLLIDSRCKTLALFHAELVNAAAVTAGAAALAGPCAEWCCCWVAGDWRCCPPQNAAAVQLNLAIENALRDCGKRWLLPSHKFC